ncbi:MAG: hypothetical protein DRI98_11600 [Bacteroidetes bacterium]|nr:MAG: hypothetical protein DRI98_11600 [Bacteroidota bacterium]
MDWSASLFLAIPLNQINLVKYYLQMAFKKKILPLSEEKNFVVTLTLTLTNIFKEHRRLFL